MRLFYDKNSLDKSSAITVRRPPRPRHVTSFLGKIKNACPQGVKVFFI